MATRIKKLFHHQKDDEDTPDSPPHEKGHFRRFPRSDKSKPSLRQSMDESGVAGDSTSGMAGRQSGTYTRGGPPQIGDLGYASTSAGHQHGHLSSEFSKLNLDGSPAAGHSSGSHPSAQPSPRQAQFHGGSPLHKTGDIRRAEAGDSILPPSSHRAQVDEHRTNYPVNSTTNTNNPAYGQQQLDQGPSRHTSIPRKEVGSGTTPPGTSSSNSRQSTLQKPLPAAPLGAEGSGIRDHSGTLNTSGLAHASARSQGAEELLTAEEVLSRAQGNTVDTTVTEKIAPAVVHETVNKEVHHIRQEVITREIHNHDYYHRILPVIDVEVLPPRHFLPVEGGGLVEINADEIPGRGKNWVIAETASKIPSGEPLPAKPNVFTAREFVGKEGDEKRYMTEEGYERTEQTWIHPPELETGGRETGQTWPMKFGERAEGRMETRTQGQTQTRSRSQSQSQSQTRSPVKEGKKKKKKGILKNATPQPAVDDRIDSPEHV
ncbi:hypothetical protein MMC30_006999 [Trapelia coarctata]|nr:hypothetical protein [Trapelia coarctata]